MKLLDIVGSFRYRQTMGKRYWLSLGHGLSLAIGFSACAPNMVVTPEVARVANSDLQIAGKVDYEGNNEYLPRTLVSTADSGTTFRYRYDVRYGRDAVHQLLPLFNPLTIVGFPIGADSVVITGTLDVLKEGATIKTYSAASVLDKHRTIFWEGESMTEMRRRGLIAVRDNIDGQMQTDKEFLLRTVGSKG